MFDLRNEESDVRNPTYSIRFSEHAQDRPQDEEWCEVLLAGEWQRLRLHDYDRIYELPGLYEQLFGERLQCKSPRRVVSVLAEILRDWAVEPHELGVLELGAGNGMVGEELRSLGVGSIVGVDILPEAAAAADRDRPHVYDNYLVADLSEPNDSQLRQIRSFRPNCLVTVAALGFADIPPRAFLTAYNLVSTPAWVAFNIKETFLTGQDNTGFSRLIRRLTDEGFMQIQSYRRYSHRLSVSGQRLHYVAIVARKLRHANLALTEAASDRDQRRVKIA